MINRDNAKEIWPIIKAYAEGKQIQFFNGDKWIDLEFPNFNEESCLYRIKPELKYRPFKNVEECWEEMQKHQPFGWIRHDTINAFLNLVSIGLNTDFRAYYTTYTFADGSPFGIKEE